MDKEILKIQRSTRTTIPHLSSAHNYCRMKFGWYYRWHLNNLASPTHWAVLSLFIVVAATFGFFSFHPGSFVNPSGVKASSYPNIVVALAGDNSYNGTYTYVGNDTNGSPYYTLTGPPQRWLGAQYGYWAFTAINHGSDGNWVTPNMAYVSDNAVATPDSSTYHNFGGYPTPDPTVTAASAGPALYIVGTGDSSVDGSYTLNGTLNGHNDYKKDSGTMYVTWNNGGYGWDITSTEGGYGSYENNNNGDPWVGQWWNYSSGPSPIVFQGSQAPAIYGHITDASGYGIYGISVSAGGGHTATTDSSGVYVIGPLTNGTYTVTPTSGSYVFDPLSRSVTMSGSNMLADFTGQDPAYMHPFVMVGASDANYNGTYNPSGIYANNPGQGKTAYVNGNGKWIWWDGNSSWQASDTRGSYGSYQNWGSSGNPPWNGTFQGFMDMSDVPFVFLASYQPVMYGRLQDAQNNGLSGVSVTDGKGHSTTSDGSGYYHFYNVANDTYTITPSNGSYVFVPLNASVVMSGSNVGTNFLGQDATYMHNFVMVGASNSSYNGTYSPSGVYPSGYQGKTAYVNGSGKWIWWDGSSYWYAGSSKGGSYDYQNYGSSGGTPWNNGSWSSMGMSDYPIFFLESAQPVIYGRVTDVVNWGNGLYGVSVADGHSHTATTDSNGNYLFTNVSSGSYTITPTLSSYVFSPANRSVTMVSSNLSANLDAYLSANYSCITVTNADDYSYDTGFNPNGSYNNQIAFSNADNSRWIWWYGGNNWWVMSTVEGGGTYGYVNMSSGNPWAGTWYDWGGGGTPTVMQGCAPPVVYYTISGTINDGSGNHIVGVTVSDGTRSAVTAVDGIYSISNVPNGSYTLTPTKVTYTFSPTSSSAVVSDGNVTGKNFTGTMASPPSAAWMDAGWSHRALITVDHTKVGTGGVTNYPVLLPGDGMPSGLWSESKSDGSDLRVTTSNGTTETNFELVSFTPGSSKMELWFLAPSLSDSADTQFYLYWDNPSANAKAASWGQGVWSNGYAAVYHMQEASGTGVADSTGNNNMGTSSSSSNISSGLIGNARTFNGSSDYITIPRTISDDFTIGMWINTSSTGGSSSQWYNGYGLVDGEVSGIMNDFGTTLGSGKFGFGTGNPDTTIWSTTHVNSGSWVNANATRVKSTGALKVYVNGVGEATGTGGTNSQTSPSVLTIGRIQAGASFYTGSIDEVHLETVARNDAWILTENNNQFSSVSFSADGSEQNQPTPPAAPSAVSIGSIDSTLFTVSWTDNSSNETGFKIYISTTPNADCSLATYPGSPDYTTAANAVSQAVTGKSINTQYCAKVVATNANGDSTPAYSSPKYTLANQPNAPTVNATSTTSLTVIINANNNPSATQFAIYNQTASQYVQANGTLGASAVWQTRSVWGGDSGIANTGLSINTSYNYQVKARNGDNTETSLSSGASKYTLANVPSAPTVNATSTTSLTTFINQNSNPSNTTYAIYETSTSKYVQADGTLNTSAVWQSYATWGSGSGIAVTGLSINVQYTFEVKARNGDSTETSLSSGAAKYTLANVPSAPTLSAVSSSSINITLTDNGSTTYAVAVSADGGITWNYVHQADGHTQASADFQNYVAWGSGSGRTNVLLSTNVQYIYKVEASNGDGATTVFSSTASKYTLASVPSAPTVAADYSIAQGYHIDLGINSNGNPAGTNYWIQYSTNGTDYSDPTGMAWQAGSSYTLTSVTPNTQHWFKVKARNGDSTETGYSAAHSCVTAPAAPTGLSSSNIFSTTAATSWVATAGADNYTFSYGTDTDATNLGVTQNIVATSKDLSGLSNSTTYYFKVYATSNANGSGAYSSIAHFSTIASVAPTAPSDFTGSAVSTSQINWTWTDTASGETGWHVQNISNTNLSDLPADSTSWSETALSANTAYTRHADVYDINGWNDSNQATVYTLANIPGTPTLNPISSGAIQIVIDKNGNPAVNTRYAIYNNTAGKYVKHADGSLQTDPDWQLYDDWGGANGIVNIGLTPNTAYSYTIKAENADRVTTDSSQVAITNSLANIPDAPVIDHLQISPNTVELKSGSTIQFSAKAYDISNTEIPNQTFVWSVVNSGGSIDANGLFTAGTDPGTFDKTVQVSIGSTSAYATVIVSQEVPIISYITVSPDSVNLTPYQKFQFKAQAFSSDGTEVPDQTFLWSVANGGGVIDQDGNFTAAGDEGTFQDTIEAAITQIKSSATVVIKNEIIPPKADTGVVAGIGSAARSIENALSAVGISKESAPPAAAGAALSLAVLSLAMAPVANLASLFSLNEVVHILFYSIVSAGTLRRKRKKWGQVLEDGTGMPLSNVFVSLIKVEEDGSEKTFENTLTDDKGLYGFAAPKGRYKVIAKKDKFLISPHDSQYYDFDPNKVYEVNGEMSGLVIPSIMMGISSKKLKGIHAFLGWFKRMEKFFNYLSIIVLTAGTVLVSNNLIHDRSLINYLILAGYFLLWIVNFALIIRKSPWSTVVEKDNGEPVGLTLVRIMTGDNTKLVKTAVTDEKGKFSAILKRGRYTILASKEGFNLPEPIRYDTDEQMSAVNKKIELTKKTKL